MIQTVHKWFWRWDFDKEEAWLNAMAAKGLTLCAVGWCSFTFQKTTPGEYNVRLELLDKWSSKAEREQYIAFLEETGAEHLATVMNWAYFRKPTTEGPFDLYSDFSSRIRMIDRFLWLLRMLVFSQLCFLISNSGNYMRTQSELSLFAGLLNVVVIALLLYGAVKLKLKKQTIEKEQVIYES